MITIRRLTYTYPGRDRPAVRDLDLEVAAGEFLLVAGPSGSGKSTVLRLPNGLVPHFYGGALNGRVDVEGRDPVALGPRGLADRVGFVGQDPEAHFVAEIVEDELAFAMENHGTEPATMARRIEEVLDQLSIAELRQRSISTLSGGEKQRVAIASVLTLQPEVLILDEPTSQLDPHSAEEVLTALIRLNHDFGLTLIVSEHRLERLLPYADRMLLLDADAPRLGPPAELLAESPLAPPLPRLAAALDWRPTPMTLKDARRHPALATLRQRLAAAEHEPAPTTATRSDVALEARGLWFSHPGAERETLAGVDLRLVRGTVTALLGRNGAGKSTLLSTFVGLLRGDRGSVRVEPRSGSRFDPWQRPLDQVTRYVALLPQNPSRLLFRDSVGEELDISLRRAGDSVRDDFESRCRELGIEALLDADPRDLSTGERQRVALAAVLAPNPDILLLDEPTRGLDAPAKVHLARWLRELAAQGLTILLASHDVELIAACAEHAVMLGDGRVVADGPIAQVLGDSAVFAPQMARLLRSPRWLTVDAVLETLASTPEP